MATSLWPRFFGPPCKYIGWSDVTESMVMTRSPFCGYNTIKWVELNGENLSCCSNKIELFCLRKWAYDHWLTNKAYLSLSQWQTFLRVFLPTRWRQKSTGIDIEQNYVTATVCIGLIFVCMHAVLSPVQWEICCSKCNGFLFCPSVCLSQVGVLLRWLNKSSWFSVCRLLSTYPTLCYKKILRSVLPPGTLSQTLDLKNFAGKSIMLSTRISAIAEGPRDALC